MRANGEERRSRRPHHDHYLWQEAYQTVLRKIELSLAAEKRGRGKRGELLHPRRVARLREAARRLYALRSEVRRLAAKAYSKPAKVTITEVRP